MLGTPPAFVLSQDQTLHDKLVRGFNPQVISFTEEVSGIFTFQGTLAPKGRSKCSTGERDLSRTKKGYHGDFPQNFFYGAGSPLYVSWRNAKCSERGSLLEGKALSLVLLSPATIE